MPIEKVYTALNANKDFKFLKTLVYVCITGFFLLSALVIAAIFTLNKTVYVVDRGEMYTAQAHYNYELSALDVENFGITFHQYLLQFEARNYYQHLEIALQMIDDEFGLPIYKKFEEDQIYKFLLDNDARYSLTVDSIHVNMDIYPYECWMIATQQVEIKGKVNTQKHKAFFKISDRGMNRTRYNPRGLKIISYATFE
ncbi:hypothetical protein [Flexithrix dorotheae]|uniref:hypothetical protein n=1 Tax=Flexithrix dorotheae TaxID=70993 RepID=UPI00035CCA1A|nr:hypothetical protein [Flexithrix dorotheae]